METERQLGRELDWRPARRPARTVPEGRHVRLLPLIAAARTPASGSASVR